ncbi:MAG: S41 family peptidase [Chloroflexota bacterium]
MVWVVKKAAGSRVTGGIHAIGKTGGKARGMIRGALPGLTAVLLLSACARPSLPGGHDGPTVAPVHAAYTDLMSKYVDRPSPSVLLGGAYKGLEEVLARAGIKDSHLQAPVLNGGQSGDWNSFRQVYNRAIATYGQRIGADKLEYGAIRQMANSLKDCQTRFLSPAEVQQQRQELSGQQAFGGIGVIMKNSSGHPTLLRVMNGPARKAGLRPGDEVIGVNGHPTSGDSFAAVRDSIRGPRGTEVTLLVRRPGVAQPISFRMTRGQVQAPVLDAAILANRVGYLHFYSFPTNVLTQLDAALRVFDQRNVAGIILDVRANSGGDQQTIVEAVSRFAKSGVVEVEVQRNGQRTPLEVDPSVYWQSPKPLALLADGDTQSGGEIFAKALQERGVPVFGLPTAGCAASGHTFPLGDGSALEISTAKILSGQGAEINHVGIVPNHRVAYPTSELAAGQDPQLAAALAYFLQPGAGGQPAVRPAPAAALPPLVKPFLRPGALSNGPVPIVK